ncbi:nucleoside phosphorylase domain-containing protein [Ilyonectria sp. MPI-CAGE-AT-0026]|nr:nucleoside phosphorylase domain-containing protein [Ilyonectria sp. MPI-CAGE-AT-0026]
MAAPTRPAHREDFHIAIICALPLEADAMTLLFDDSWDDDNSPYGQASQDTNTYTTGRIGLHNVVLVILENMGTSSAAAATVNLRSSYNNIELALLVGICGGVPRIAGEDVFLGDVVLSRTIIQYDYGRQYPGNFVMKNTVEDSLGRASKGIRSLLVNFETRDGKDTLQTKAKQHLKRLQNVAETKRLQSSRRRRAEDKYRYPGSAEDKLYSADYTHIHRTSCDLCVSGSGDFCESSKASCAETGCDEANLVVRAFPFEDDDYTPEIFIGRVGSGNTVMKSGKDRDRIAAAHNLIAFEMEGAGIWEEIPCIVVKGVCDYADSHKNKKWQDFAAATAASVARAILERYFVNYEPQVQALEASNAQGNGLEQTNSIRTVANNSFGNNVKINQGDSWGDVTF